MKVVSQQLYYAQSIMDKLSSNYYEMTRDVWDDEAASKVQAEIDENKQGLIEKLEAALQAARGI
jgi:hypothetical protein